MKRIAVVVGAGRIGCALALRFGVLGFEVSIASHEDLELKSPASVRHYFERFERIHVLVNAAGSYGAIGRVGDVSPEAWLDAFMVNAAGAYTVCHCALPKLMQPGGHIINLAGGGAVDPVSHLSSYGASKAALLRLTQTLALEYPGVYTNCISPGPIVSRMQEQLLAAGPSVPAYPRIRAMCESGVDEVPLEKTMEVLDHILAARPTGQLFFARTFKGAALAA